MFATIPLGPWILATSLVLGSAVASAQPAASTEPRNVVQLSASGTVEAAQDWLTLTLSVSREGSEAAAVQQQLREALDAALPELKKTAQPGLLEVRSGAFGLQQRYGKDGKISGWLGSTELVLEGSDFSRISAAAARARSLVISGISFGLSRTSRDQLETRAQALAIEGFRRKAGEIARGFGFADYSLRDVNVAVADGFAGPQPRMMALGVRAMAADAAPVPLESGKSLVVVTVSGGVQLK